MKPRIVRLISPQFLSLPVLPNIKANGSFCACISQCAPVGGIPGSVPRPFCQTCNRLDRGSINQVNHLPHPGHVQAPLASSFSYCETYQTNLNQLRHSKLLPQRLTLVRLAILRVPPMVRNAFIALLLATFAALSAGAARIDAVHTRHHASVKQSSTHRLHHPVARTKTRLAHKSVSRRQSQAASHRSVHPATPSRHRVAYTARHKTPTLRRTRYTRHSRAHFVPLATVPVRRNSAEPEEKPETETAPLAASTALPVNEPGAVTASQVSDETPPAPERPSRIETDVVPSAGQGDSLPREGNPLADPPLAGKAIEPAIGQSAELHVPRVYGRYALRGTHDSLVRQNERSEQESLQRIEDDADLQDRIARGMLVHVPETTALMVNPTLPEDRRYCRPWTADFLSDLSRSHQAQFHKPLILSSAVRTVEYQRRLMRINHNAADAEGDIVSPHLTGATIDIAKSGLSRRELQWMRDHLFAYQTAGVIDVEEEFRQRCFHITVYKSYVPASQTDRPHHGPVPQTVPPTDTSTATTSDSVADKQR